MSDRESRGAFVFVVAALVGAFLGLATASPSTTISTLFFFASTVAALIAARHTSSELAGPDRLGAVGANLSSAGATIFGIAAVQSVGPDWPGLSIVVAPICGLSAVWWFAHARYADNPRWLVALIGSGFGGFFGFGALIISALNENDDVTTLHRIGFALAGVVLLNATAITVAGAVGFVKAARRPT